jgi:hypothetical protein
LHCKKDGLLSIDRSKRLSSNITALKPLSNFLLIGLENGEIQEIDLDVLKKKQNGINNSKSPTSFSTISDDILFSTFNDGSSVLYDLRTSQPQASFQFNGITNITSSCNIPNANNVVTVGFEEGVFSIIDLRIMKPVWLSMSPPVKQIFAIDSPKTTSSFVITSDDCVVSINEPSNFPSVKIATSSPACALYQGGCAVLSTDAAWYVHSSGCVSLYDGQTSPMNVLSNRPSLSMHSAQVTSCKASNEWLISGDAAGFVNLSSIMPC